MERQQLFISPFLLSPYRERGWAVGTLISNSRPNSALLSSLYHLSKGLYIGTNPTLVFSTKFIPFAYDAIHVIDWHKLVEPVIWLYMSFLSKLSHVKTNVNWCLYHYQPLIMINIYRGLWKIYV
jgi:hypothetical protein